jgi:lipid A 4'-phosphatase
MSYLRLVRSRVIVGSFLAFAAVISAFPDIDLRISSIFYDGVSFLRAQWWADVLQKSLGYFLCISIAGAIALYAYNRLRHRKICNVDGRRVVFLLLVAIIGAGLIVNVAFKNSVGRARPRDVAEFGGKHTFSPAFALSDQCQKNCSFSSGDSAAAFYSLALAMALTRRRRFFAVGLAFGAVVSLARVAAGAHFFSDCVVSFYVMFIVADVLYYYLVMSPADRREAATSGIRLRPAFVPEAPTPIAEVAQPSQVT